MVVPEGVHKAMMELLYRYVIVGGLPEVVNCFLETKNIELIYKLQRNLIAEYEEDRSNMQMMQINPISVMF